MSEWILVAVIGVYTATIMFMVWQAGIAVRRAYNTGLEAGFRKSTDLPPDVQAQEDEALKWLAEHADPLDLESPGEDEEAGNHRETDYMKQPGIRLDRRA